MVSTNDEAKLELAQKEICRRAGTRFVSAPFGLTVGVSRNVRSGILPLNGLRHMPEFPTTGWYLWAGEVLRQEEDFFVPLHVEHLQEWCPEALRYLGLPPGWRFLVADDYEDTWFDDKLLKL